MHLIILISLKKKNVQSIVSCDADETISLAGLGKKTKRKKNEYIEKEIKKQKTNKQKEKKNP